MTTITFIEDSTVRADTPVAEDLKGLVAELGDLTGNLQHDVSIMAQFLAHDIDLNMNRDEMKDVLVRLVSTAGILRSEAANATAIRDKAAGTIDG